MKVLKFLKFFLINQLDNQKNQVYFHNSFKLRDSHNSFSPKKMIMYLFLFNSIMKKKHNFLYRKLEQEYLTFLKIEIQIIL